MSLTFATEIFPNDDGTLKLGDSDKKWKINGGGTSTQYLKGDGTWDTPVGTYSLPTASSSTKGGIKVNGNGLKVESDILKHSNSVIAKTTFGSTATFASANGGSITVTDIKYDANGHITGSQDRTITLSQTTYTIAGLMGSTAKGSSTLPIYWTGTAFSTISSYQGNAATATSATSATKATQDGSGNVITSTYVKKAGDTMTGNLIISKTGDTYVEAKNTETGCRIEIDVNAAGKHGLWSSGYYANSTYTASSKWIYYRGTDGEAHSDVKIYGAVWNDYAEYRITKEVVEPGRCVIETGDDDLELSVERMQPGAEIVSDTFGFAIGQTDEAKTPIASNGRVLAYPFESIEEFRKNIGHPVCSGPNGTVSIMTDEEYQKYGYCAIGTISAIPSYEEWGEDKVKVNGRVWIRIK